MHLVVRADRSFHLIQPRLQRSRGVATAQPEVRDRSQRNQRSARPFLLVGDHKRGAMRAEHAVGLLFKPRLVAKLRSDRAGERTEQRIEKTRVALSRRRELQQNGSEAFAKRREAIPNDPSQPHAIEGIRRVRESAVSLHAEPE